MLAEYPRKSSEIELQKDTIIQSYTMSTYGIAKGTRLAVFCAPFFFLSIQPGLADSLSFNSDDTVTVTAERAWEADEADVIHFSGQFEMRASDWSLLGDTAVVYGKLDNPDRVVVEGKPARISFLRDSDDDAGTDDPAERVDGAALFVEYFRATDKLFMRGGASLIRKDSTLVSDVVEYNIGADRYSASGEGGINVQFNPDDN